MPISKQARVILHFGTSDIMIAPCANAPDEPADHVAIGTIDGGKPRPIDVTDNAFEGQQMDDWAVKMYFGRVESLNALIHVLEDFRTTRFGVEQMKGEGQ